MIDTWSGGRPDAPEPLCTDSVGRAVYKAAPKRFTIQFLPPTKLGSSYYHGARISSIPKSERHFRSSVSSEESTVQYDVWRRWEDCLWLQDTLENEYKRAAREKKTRLAQGKGVKAFNGMYKQDMASSWESLPPGPEPTSIATDIHAYLPSLTKKSSFFRPNPATVEHRQEEYQALIEALMSDDVPALIKEIRSCRTITDFFGYWRRDIEFEEKYRKKNPHLSTAPLSSIANSVFSTYFSSTSSQQSIHSSSRSSKRSLTSSIITRPDSIADSVTSSSSTGTSMTTASSFKSRKSLDSAEALKRAERDSRRHSSSSSSSAQSEEAVSDSSCTANSSAPKIAEGSPPVKFNHNPNRGHEPPSPVQEEAPVETSKSSVKSPVESIIGNPFHIARRKADNRQSNRNWQVFGSPVSRSSSGDSFQDIHPDLHVEESWHDFIRNPLDALEGAQAYLEGLDLKLPKTPKEERSSMSSVNTADSADAVIPDRKLHMPQASVPVRVSLSDFEFSESSAQMSLLIAPRPLSHLTEEEGESEYPDSRPETPMADLTIMTPSRRSNELPSLRIPSPTTSYFSASPSPIPASLNHSPAPPSRTNSSSSNAVSVMTAESSATITPKTAISVTTQPEVPFPVAPIAKSTSTSSAKKSFSSSITLKVSLNTSIIMVKVSRDISYADMRQRIYNKFVGQEGIPLSQEFTIMTKSGDMIIESDEEWLVVEGACGESKLQLQVINGPPS